MLFYKVKLLLFIQLNYIILVQFTQGQNAGNESSVQAAPDEGNTPEAILYEKEDKTGMSITYTEYLIDFDNVIPLMMSMKMQSASLLCAKGVYVLYNQDHFTSDNDDDVIIFAGKDLDTCIPPGFMKSLLLVQNHNDIFQDSLALFNNERFVSIPFESHVFVDHQNEQNIAFQVMKMKEVASFIMMGPEGWTVFLMKEGSTDIISYCISPSLKSEYPICPVPYANYYFGDNLYWIEVRRGCEGGGEKIELIYCFDYGPELKNISDFSTVIAGIENPDVTPPPPTGPSENATNVTMLMDDCDGLDEFAALLRLRITHDFENTFQVQFPLNKMHTWRTEILDNTLEIVRACTSNDLPNPRILYMVREMYIYFAEKMVWNQGLGWPSKPKQRVLLVAHETARCLRRIYKNGWTAVSKNIIKRLLNSLSSPAIPEIYINSHFKSRPELDTIMEFVWLSINFAAAACHQGLEYETDFWMDYLNVAYDMYLQPMVEFWGNPGKPLEYYPILFGGFNIRRQYRMLAAVTSSLYDTTKLDKLPRPKPLDYKIEDKP